MRHARWVVVLFAALLLGAAPVAAGEPMVPFKATAQLASETPSGCGPFGGTVSVYRGQATHLGLFELTETVCYTKFEYPVIDFTVASVYVAANGDRLESNASGAFNVMTGEKTGEGFKFTGGTGRFEHAAGGGSTRLLFDSEFNVTGLVQTGWVSY